MCCAQIKENRSARREKNIRIATALDVIISETDQIIDIAPYVNTIDLTLYRAIELSK